MNFPHTITRASAGTGKTFQLSNRYLGLVHHGHDPARILATTFARKAAGEIQDRILIRLADAIEKKGDRELLASFIADGTLTVGRCRQLLRLLTANLHRLRVGTIDSFFGNIARSFALELGIPPGWQIISDTDDRALRDRATAEVLAAGDQKETLQLVHWLTKGEASRSVSRLLRSTVDDLYQLYLETSDDAWHQLPNVKPLSEPELAMAIDDLRELPLEKASFKKARNADLERATIGDWPKFLTTGLAAKVAAGEDFFSRQEIPVEVKQVYERLTDHAAAVMISRLKFQTEGAHRWLSQFHQAYQRLKNQHRAMRFDDVTRAVAQVGRGGSVDRLAFRLGAGIDHLLLDEFQDTSPQQWQAVRPFAQGVTADEAGRSFYCVGDIKQAIYGWRGGVAEIFDTVSSELGVKDGPPLAESFRSSQVIIDTVNEVFSHLTNHPNLDRAEPAIANFQKKFPPHATAKKGLPGYACLQTAPRAGKDESQSDVTLTYAADQIVALTKAHPGRSIGVLCRTNDAIGQLIYQLRHRGVMASEEGGVSLTDSAAVLLVLSLLRLADHPGDTAALFHLAGSPWAAELGLSENSSTQEDVPSEGQEDADSQTETKRRQRRAAVNLSRQVRRSLLAHGYGRTIYDWARQLTPMCNRRELSRLKQLVELAYAYDASATLRTRDFLLLVDDQHIADPIPADVRVMTIHKSKGLEFDIVVLPQLDHPLTGQTPGFVVERPSPTSDITCVSHYAAAEIQALLPKRFQEMFEQHTYREVTELMCVAYVAITRAVHSLHMIIAPSTASEKNPPKKLEAVLRCALKDSARVEEESLVWQTGDPAWDATASGGRQSPESGADLKPPGDEQPLEVRLKPSDGQLHRGLDTQAPSALHYGSKVNVAELFRRELNTPAMLRGSIIHAWFEAIEWLDDGPPEDDELRRIAAHTASGQMPIESWLKEFRQMLTLGNTATLLTKGNYGLQENGITLEVRQEFPFVYREDGKLLEGSIDRLVLQREGEKVIAADVIDFKTDTDLTDPATRHGQQMQAYRRAVARYFNLQPDKINARLLMVKDGSIVEIAP